MPPTLGKLLREPLLHFLLVGLALFALERAVRRPGPASDPLSTRIVVSAGVRASLRDGWTTTHGTAPSAAELDELVARWVEDELLYREGLARGLERDDPRVRQRIAGKMAFVLKSEVIVPEPSDTELRAWFDEHADRWAKDELVDFVQVFVEGDDDAARARAAQLLRELSAGADPAGLGDPFSGGRRYRRRRKEDLAQSFGNEFAAAIGAQPEGSWAMSRSRYGLHLVRVERRTAAQAPDFAAVKLDLRKDWEDTRRHEGFTRSLEKLRERWKVVVEP